jgi:hypothetical protein
MGQPEFRDGLNSLVLVDEKERKDAANNCGDRLFSGVFDPGEASTRCFRFEPAVHIGAI